MSEGNAGSSTAEFDSAEVEELDRRVFCSTGTIDSSATTPSTGDVKGEMVATRCVAGMRVRKLWVGLDILATCGIFVIVLCWEGE